MPDYLKKMSPLINAASFVPLTYGPLTISNSTTSPSVVNPITAAYSLIS